MKTIEARVRRREAAYSAWQEAKQHGEIEEARMRAQASTRVDKEIVNSAKSLLSLMGISYIMAPGEGEAQASYMCGEDLVYAAGSQDYDTLLFGSKRVVRNLTFSGRRKLPRKNVYINVDTELISLEETLGNLGITRHQLIWIGIMLGNDFNEGIKGIGPKTALKIAKESASLKDVEARIKEKFGSGFDTDVSEVEALFLKPEVKELSRSELLTMMPKRPDISGIVSFMCDEYGFSKERISKYAERLAELSNVSSQSSISKWL
ncbi:flap structure-specific endonuclease [Candidatus Marsarchaeota archaeon]|nr:flap structure-specific endonuclease [Candidatus Marsarchaeota archaeon]